VQATLCELTAVTIVDSLLNHSHIKQLIICGGGAYNDFLIARLKDVLGSKSLSGVQILKSDSIGIEPQLVESAAFAWLAYLNRHNLAGNIAAVTGAKKGVVLGQLALP
jgi:anhydro-N-acetylmuramic acid kinase